MDIAELYQYLLDNKVLSEITLKTYRTNDINMFINNICRNGVMPESTLLFHINSWGKLPVELEDLSDKDIILKEDIIDNFEEFERYYITPYSIVGNTLTGLSNSSENANSGVISFTVPLRQYNIVNLENLRRYLKAKFGSTAWELKPLYVTDDTAQMKNYRYRELFRGFKGGFNLSNNLNLRQKLQRIYNDAISHRIMDIVFNLVDGELKVYRKYMNEYFPYKEVQFSPRDIEGFKTKLFDSGGVPPASQDSEPAIDFSIKNISEDDKYDGRVNYSDTERGWEFHIRLVNMEFNNMTYDDYELTRKVKYMCRNALLEKDGIILVTGARGAGKQVFCYATINEFLKARPNSFIETYENPVESRLDGPIAQIEVKPEKGWGFAYYLRAMKRHSSNLYFIGEIRDKETAEGVTGEGVSAALVLSTTHAPDSAGVIGKLSYEIGSDDSTLIKMLNSLRVVTNLTMVKKICPKCSQKVTKESLTEGEKVFLDSWNYRGNVYKRNPGGCEYCRSKNYEITNSRESDGDLQEPLIIVEGLEFDYEVRDIIQRYDSIPRIENEIRRSMIKSGSYKTQIALAKMHEGKVSLETIMRNFGKNIYTNNKNKIEKEVAK